MTRSRKTTQERPKLVSWHPNSYMNNKWLHWAFSEPLHPRQWENRGFIMQFQPYHISNSTFAHVIWNKNTKQLITVPTVYLISLEMFLYSLRGLNYLDEYLSFFLPCRDHLIFLKCSQLELSWGPYPDQAANKEHFTCIGKFAKCSLDTDALSKAYAVLGETWSSTRISQSLQSFS